MSRDFGRFVLLSLLVHLGAFWGWSLWTALEPLELPAHAVMHVQVVTRPRIAPAAPPQAETPKKTTPAKPKAPTAPKKAVKAPAKQERPKKDTVPSAPPKTSASLPPARSASAAADSTARTSGAARTLPGSSETGKTPSAAPAVAWNASPLHAPKPEYPKIARRMKREGRVLLRVAIAPDGSVKQVVVREKSRFPELDEAAVKAVKGWRFAPDTKGHEVDVPVEFRIDA